MRRSGWALVVFILVALIVAGALAYNYIEPTAPPLPSEQVEERSGRTRGNAGGEGKAASEPMALNPSAQNEIECVDRLLRNGAPAGADQKAEWDRCAALGEAAVAAEARREQEARDAGGNGASEKR